MTNDAAYVIGGLRVVRCYASPGEYDSEGAHWGIEGLVVDPPTERAEGRPRDLAIVGELFAHSRVDSVAVTVEAQISYTASAPSGLRSDPAVQLAEVRRIGDEIQHVLYDLAAGTAGSISALTQLTAKIPAVTPEAKIDLIAPEASGGEET